MEFEVAKPEHIFFVRSSIKNYVNENKMWVSDKMFKQLNETIREILEKAIKRAKLNKRRTIFPQDVI